MCNADRRRRRSSLSATSSGASIGLPLSQSARPLLHAHNPRIGTAAASDCGRVRQISAPKPIARKGIQSRYRSIGVSRFPISASAAVSHSSNRSRVIQCRTSARTTASSASRVWCASKASVKQYREHRRKKITDWLRAPRAYFRPQSSEASKRKFHKGRHKQNTNRGQSPRNGMPHHEPAK